MQSKRCTKCGEVKSESSFSRDRTRSDGLEHRCKECVRAYNRAYREAHREEQRAYREAHLEERRAYNRAYHESRREELLAHKRTYWEDHREEFNAQCRKRQTEVLKASREVSTRNGEPWTPAEDHVVLTSEWTVLEIAIELGRTTSSVKNRRTLLHRKAVTA